MRGVPNSKRLSVSGKALSKQFDCSITIHNSSSKEIGVAFRFLALIIDNRDPDVLLQRRQAGVGAPQDDGREAASHGIVSEADRGTQRETPEGSKVVPIE